MEEMRVSYLLNRLVYGDRPCSAEDILYMVTAGGAKVLGRELLTKATSRIHGLKAEIE